MVENNSWYFANLPAAAINRWIPARSLDLPHQFLIIQRSGWMIPRWWGIPYLAAIILKPLSSLLAFYLIVRSKIVDTGPVLSRMVAYVVIVLLVVALFTLANAVFGQVFPGYALLVPIEILAALVIGYWVSGLRDLASCYQSRVSMLGVLGRKGHPRDERDALTHSLRLAQRTRRPGVIAEVHAQIAFSSMA